MPRGTAVEQVLALCFVQPAPDPVRFLDANGVVKALFSDRTAAADRLCLLLPAETLLFALDVCRWEEHDSLWTAASSSYLPRVVKLVGDHEPPPCSVTDDRLIPAAPASPTPGALPYRSPAPVRATVVTLSLGPTRHKSPVPGN